MSRNISFDLEKRENLSKIKDITIKLFYETLILVESLCANVSSNQIDFISRKMILSNLKRKSITEIVIVRLLVLNSLLLYYK